MRSYQKKISTEGGMMIQPLMFDWSYDQETMTHANSSFMVGNAIKIDIPIESGVTNFSSYFPNDDW